MELLVYKGFDEAFLSLLTDRPLVENDIYKKINVLQFDKSFRRQLQRALLSLEEGDKAWITYEEYALIKRDVDNAMDVDGVQVTIYINNLYPDYYPISFDISDEVVSDIKANLDSNSMEKGLSEACIRYFDIYANLVEIDGTFFGSFYNYEYDQGLAVRVSSYYQNYQEIKSTEERTDIDIYINEDIETYLRDLSRIKTINPSVIGVKQGKGIASERILKSLQSYCSEYGISLVNFNESLGNSPNIREDLIDIAKNDIGIDNFQGFRHIKFYKDPDIDKEVIEVSQSTLIQEIIRQAEIAYNDIKGHSFRDIFITASTGAGKSIIFQIPAIYLAKQYHKLTIIIEPVKALMQDQKEKLIRSGYNRVATFNSDLISQNDKEVVLKQIREGEIDLLYLSPETLLSYSIETIIGDREIGLLIVDEAHIVTTWGLGFRPDYWYLGGYINKLRNQIQTTVGKKRKVYKFPICAFTATAVNGGVDDSVGETIISLYMENPIKFIGYVKRDDIHFDIKVCEERKISQSKYKEMKTQKMNERINIWLNNNEKTITYFPYARSASDAAQGSGDFFEIKQDQRIGVYTGRNVDNLSEENFKEKRKEVFEQFRVGRKIIIYATKAFGMGIDIDDVKNVYHYAASGNLCDYVQEIGRVARKKEMTGRAITDFFYNDMTYMNTLFGMSQIRPYQIRKVLEGIYDVYKNKNRSRNFLISPTSFTYIFNGKNENQSINKLKTCLLMLEKDFYDKYNFKVLISRPQGIFTKAYAVIDKEYENQVLDAYGKYFEHIASGRSEERQPDGSCISDCGDIFLIKLKQIWEDRYKEISFPQFKYHYFNDSSAGSDEKQILGDIREYLKPRQKVNIETRKEKILLSEIQESIFEDFEYIGNTLHENFGKSYFTLEAFEEVIHTKYGRSQAKIIANSLFDLVDPNGKCVKHKINEYMIAYGNFKEYMRAAICKARIVRLFTQCNDTRYSSFISISKDKKSNIALKLLSIFNYISYEILGGEEPEIFIRLNDPQKIKNIVMGNIYYFNSYVAQAKQRHERDVSILKKFFIELHTDEERWEYIEDYFLGNDVLGSNLNLETSIEMYKVVDDKRSYSTYKYKSWKDLYQFFDDNDRVVLNKLARERIVIPEYLKTIIKKSNLGDDILMSWPSKNTLICQQDTADQVINGYIDRGWTAYRIDSIDFKELKECLGDGNLSS